VKLFSWGPRSTPQAIEERQPSVLNGEVFKNKRLELKLTTSEVARSTCLSTTMIDSIENGSQKGFYSNDIKISAAKRVAKFLEIDESHYLSEQES
jgi:cytoskeleton protein RodZ